MTLLPCPNCGSELALLEQYHRHFCYACGRYAPEGYGDHGAKLCPTCRGVLSYVTQYDRYYCYRCGAYPPDDSILQSIEEVAPSASAPQMASQEPTTVVTEPPKAEEPMATPVEAPVEASQPPEEVVEEESPEQEPATSDEKPPLVRDEILQAKKPFLMDLCKAYDLDPTGTKDQLRERLLSYLDTLETEAEPEEIAAEGEADVGPALAEPTPELESEPPTPVEQAAVEEAPVVDAVVEGAPAEEMAPATTPTEAPVVEETRPEPSETAVESAPEAVVSVAEQQLVTEVAPRATPPGLTHPCPTCGRELTYIALYQRWYCYRCRAYAPVGTSRFACPSCGAALRWIGQYERWWCDACRRYAPADLPKPESAAVAAPAVVERPLAQVAAFSARTFVHQHRSPGSGIGLVGFGTVLFLLYEVLVDLPAALSFSTGIVVSPDLAFGLRFFAFVFVAVGAIMGLAAVRDRR